MQVATYLLNGGLDPLIFSLGHPFRELEPLELRRVRMLPRGKVEILAHSTQPVPGIGHE